MAEVLCVTTCTGIVGQSRSPERRVPGISGFVGQI